ncbi:hypothetical protein BDV37DRAFT_266380 [Aspergillus pseudonomiae]|uniref:Secreted protein n=1 Tax=Aspergillus pseudonomiae TaxID=1506151 RepID=A0A5N7CSH3_9EURO|nr:uncharacterized protein BDV37DRAFT_266380 [Aspergillus pseudonomiae]KAE8397161.1 hypothetical protein BDV37DRAFT_266380 [Aspergillus pseudonomiae]
MAFHRSMLSWSLCPCTGLLTHFLDLSSSEGSRCYSRDVHALENTLSIFSIHSLWQDDGRVVRWHTFWTQPTLCFRTNCIGFEDARRCV